MLIAPYTGSTEYQTLKQRLHEGKADLYPLPVIPPDKDIKPEIQPQPIPDLRPTPIPEPDRVTLSQPTEKTAALSLTYRADGRVAEETTVQADYLSQMMQAMTDARVGFDREKYEALQEKIDEILAKDDLTAADRAQIEALEQEQSRLFEVAAKRTAEQTANKEKV
ncbi:hypothetical protein [Alkalimonas amylolytica]|uniref:Uncharacterized protein n=1 Tax=Alkalimonas amylolytica TaxID=152573 RepID=A0A1H4AUH4_ALKAM|nr:hypothetical protein [Alkalimonas amylolytica]SEA39579.1 hypothetical protein SAMN04488051_10335 [Alkalimonas amylolytica]